MKYDLILYDLDGTVWDSIPMIMKCFKHAYIEVMGKCERSDEDLKSYIGRPLVETFAMHDEETSQALLKSYLALNGKLLENDDIELFDGVGDELKKIKEMGIPQGVVTSKRIVSASVTLRFKHLDDFFDVYICKEDTEKHKPDPEPLMLAAKRLGITDMSRVIYIGDAIPDALCAKNAGCGFALVEWSQMDHDAVLAAAPSGSRIIKKFSDVLDMN
ncbi:MAG: HAD-IA family hydrolase [Lachnospiraceae bacterium]|nr:HAD-IA family hydrolase [Lachnospiraceae bacterium]